jgi:hypothetical protein
MASQEDITQQQKLLETYRRNLRQLRQAAAEYGGEAFAPLQVSNGIHETRASIRPIKELLRDWGVPCENLDGEADPSQPDQSLDPSQQLYAALLRLDYTRQERLFLHYVQNHRIAAFLIHGQTDRYGQRWLLNRLLQQKGFGTTAKTLRIDLLRRTRGSDLSALWRELCGRVNLRWPQPTEAIAGRVAEWIKTQSVVLIFDNVKDLLEVGISDFVAHFWQPLVNTAQANPLDTPHRLLMFLLDHDGAGPACGEPLVDASAPDWQPHRPLKLPAICAFSEHDLSIWIEVMGGTLPPPFPPLIDELMIDQTIQEILANSDQGVPQLTLEYICAKCECNWYDKEQVWLKF